MRNAAGSAQEKPRTIRPLASRWVVLALAFAGITAWADDGTWAGETGLYASWRSPHGELRATDAVVVACDDTARVDTLYLGFELPRPRPLLSSISAVLFFHPVAGDTLGDFWFFEGDGANASGMLIDFPPFPDVSCPVPWKPVGDPDVAYEHFGGRGRLELWYPIPELGRVPLAEETRYCLARVRILHRRRHLAGCLQPVCVEWERVRMQFATGRTIELTRGGQRFASWNSLDGKACRPFRGIQTEPWRPGSHSKVSRPD